MKKFFRVPYEEESAFSEEEMNARLSRLIQKQSELQLYKLSGSPLFLLTSGEGGEYTLSYHDSYKKDMCDTCLRFYLEKGLERCSAKGFFCKPRGIWAFFWGIISTLLIDFIVLSYCFLFTAGFDPFTGLMISASAIAVRAYLCMSLMQFTNGRIKIMKEEMLRILRSTDDENDEKGESAENEGN